MRKVIIQDNQKTELVVETDFNEKFNVIKFNKNSFIAKYFKTSGLTLDRLKEFIVGRIYKQSNSSNLEEVIRQTNLKNFQDNILVFIE